ncbi:hypothetical protein I4U23_008205 [Adineta vaga]|nr:hypothetical protein I4U23_008205 [Adineta vaga]
MDKQMNNLVSFLILFLNITKVYNRSVSFDTRENSYLNNKWESGYHPFPEMNRFLNPYSQIHYQEIKRKALIQSNYAVLQYICSISNSRKHIEDILLIFGERFRPLIKKIIEEDCSHYDIASRLSSQ